MLVEAEDHLQNAHRHIGRVGADPYASRVAVMGPRTSLMRKTC
jgi:hypothetical protein